MPLQASGPISICEIGIELLCNVGVWSAGGTLITARAYFGGAGTQNESLVAGGSGVSGDSSATEEYTGTSWASGGGLITI
jgi:hypothetical protein